MVPRAVSSQDHGPARRQLAVVAMAPDLGIAREIGLVVALAARVVPETDGHRRERPGADEFSFLPHQRAAVLVPDLDLHAEAAALQLAAPHRQDGIGVGETRHDVGAAGNRRQAYVALDL